MNIRKRELGLGIAFVSDYGYDRIRTAREFNRVLSLHRRKLRVRRWIHIIAVLLVIMVAINVAIIYRGLTSAPLAPPAPPALPVPPAPGEELTAPLAPPAPPAPPAPGEELPAPGEELTAPLAPPAPGGELTASPAPATAPAHTLFLPVIYQREVEQ